MKRPYIPKQSLQVDPLLMIFYLQGYYLLLPKYIFHKPVTHTPGFGFSF